MALATSALAAADKAKQLAFPGRRRAAADRAFDKGRAILQRGSAGRFHGVRAHGAHVDHELAGKPGFQEAVRGR